MDLEWIDLFVEQRQYWTTRQQNKTVTRRKGSVMTVKYFRKWRSQGKIEIILNESKMAAVYTLCLEIQ